MGLEDLFCRCLRGFFWAWCLVWSVTATAAAPEDSISVIIDPGHGGKDTGAAFGKFYEKELVLEVSKLIQQVLAKHPFIKATLTRSEDIFIPLQKRVKIARDAKADLFISVHANSVPLKKQNTVNGLIVFSLSPKGASSKLASLIAKNEEDAILLHEKGEGNFVGLDQGIVDSLFEISMASVQTESIQVSNFMVEAFKKKGIKLFRRPVQQANFSVLRIHDVPAVLVEIGFMSNRYERQKLKDKSYLKKLSQGAAQGVLDYFQNETSYQHIFAR